MIKREVRESLLEKLKISKQALSQRANRLKEKHGPMTTEEAVYIIAHTEGVDLSKYLPLAMLDRIRSLIPREINQTSEISQVSAKKKISRKPKPQKASYPLVTSTLFQKAKAAGDDAFPRVFILENSIRSLIKLRLSSVDGNWWPKLIPKQVIESVDRTMKKERKYPYREKRGNEPLMYCNFDDLRKIIADDNNYPFFQDVVIDIDWFKVKMQEVYMARNNLAHSIPLSKDDFSSIILFYNQWARLLESAGIK
ncbi:MAG: hypothetical protein Q8N56_02240 [bacterium]|nr:hypothetical protein [bacterium]